MRHLCDFSTFFWVVSHETLRGEIWSYSKSLKSCQDADDDDNASDVFFKTCFLFQIHHYQRRRRRNGIKRNRRRERRKLPWKLRKLFIREKRRTYSKINWKYTWTIFKAHSNHSNTYKNWEKIWQLRIFFFANFFRDIFSLLQNFEFFFIFHYFYRDFFFNFFLFFLGFFNQFFSEFFSIIFFQWFFWRSWVFYAWLQFLLKNLHWDSLLNECHENAKLRRFLMHARDEPIHHLKCPHLSQFLSQTIPKKGKTYFFSLEKF